MTRQPATGAELYRIAEALVSVDAELIKSAADEIVRLRHALRIIAGLEQCVDNLMSNVDVASAALDATRDA